MQGHLFVVSAPSGAGKTSLIEALAASDASLAVSISHTTRAKRAAERDGIHYHFVSRADFTAMRDAGEFLEWADVFGHAYGTSRQAVRRAIDGGRDVILEIDWQGAAQVRRSWPDAVTIFVLPPSRAALARRLNDRGQDDAEVIARRMRQAAADMSHHGDFDHAIVNDDFPGRHRSAAPGHRRHPGGNPPAARGPRARCCANCCRPPIPSIRSARSNPSRSAGGNLIASNSRWALDPLHGRGLEKAVIDTSWPTRRGLTVFEAGSSGATGAADQAHRQQPEIAPARTPQTMPPEPEIDHRTGCVRVGGNGCESTPGVAPHSQMPQNAI